jgi:hypothetical protein
LRHGHISVSAASAIAQGVGERAPREALANSTTNPRNESRVKALRTLKIRKSSIAPAFGG